MRPGTRAHWLEGGGIALLLALSVGFESLFVCRGLNEVDEGWPLYAAMQLHAGHTLYRDVFFVFPPGHLLPAWIAFAVDPPGVVLARGIYAAFDVALVLALYALGRRIMPRGYAWLGAALVALAAPLSHQQQLLFGYRYLLWSALALLAFGERLRGGDRRWMLASGLLAGVGLCFRLTPALAVAGGIAAGAVLAGSPRRAAGDLLAFAGGALLAVIPVFGALAVSAGPDVVWREVFVRPVWMTALQSRPVPPLRLPASADRAAWTVAFVSALFRLVPVVYLAAGALLARGWWTARRRGESFDAVLTVALVVFGAIYASRAYGRSDEAHLASALPPFCVVLAWLASRALRRAPPALAAGAGAALLAAWTGLGGADRYLDPAMRGTLPLEALGGRVAVRAGHAWVDPTLRALDEATEPGARLLVLGPQSLLHVLSGRPGPGGADVLMPGTFLADAEERAFVQRLERDPPAVVLRPTWPFDLRADRSVERTAPRVVAWVEAHYRPDRDLGRFSLWLPRDGR